MPPFIKKPQTRGFLWILLGVSVWLFPNFSWATDKIWTGASSTSWSTNANWTGNAPAASDAAIFNSTFSNQPAVGGNSSAGGIWITTGIGQSFGISGAGTLTLSGTTINGTGGLGVLADNGNSCALTISTGIKLGGTQTWRNSSGNLLTVSGAIDTNTKGLTIDGSGNTTLSGVVNDNGSLTMSGSGILTLSGSNTYSGGTTINSGTVVVNSATSLGDVTVGATLNGGTIEVATGYTTTRVLTLGSASSTFGVDSGQTFTISSAIGGTGTLNKTYAGTMVLSGANTYTGGTNINGGILQAGSSGALGSSGTISFGGGTLQYSASNTTDYSSRFSNAAGQSYSVDTNGQSVTLASNLTSSGGTFAKSGTGTLTLTGTNTFNGATTVNAGTLLLSTAGGNSALGSTSGITVNSGGTLQLGASNQINSTATMTLAGGTFAKGNFAEGTTIAAGIGALTLTASGSTIDFGTGTVGILNFASLNASTFTLNVSNWTGSANTIGSGSTDRLIFDSDQSANLSHFAFAGYASGAMEFALGGGFYEVVPIPEVRTFVPGLLAMGVVVGSLPRALRRSRKVISRVRA